MSDQQRVITLRIVIQLLVFIVAAPFLPLLISRRWSWWEGWAYAIISILGFVVSRMLAARRHPDVIAERAQHLQQENIKPWDKRLSVWLMLSGVAVLLVAGLDERFGWSPAFGWPVKLLALVVILAGYALSSYALIENRFFSSTVRTPSAKPSVGITSFRAAPTAGCGIPVTPEGCWPTWPHRSCWIHRGSSCPRRLSWFS